MEGDSWHTVQSWAMFSAVVLGLGYYYWPKQRIEKPLPQLKELKDVKKDVKRPTRRQEQEKGASSNTAVHENSEASASKKRKTPVRPTQQNTSADVADEVERDDEIDMSTRQFAANMQKARDGVQVKSSNKNETRVKTVKAKKSVENPPILSSGSSQADAEEDWPSTGSYALQAGGVDDMLEPTPAGPTSLRITASEKPAKDKINKPAKKDAVETKKQRQNRKKVEERKQALAEEERARKARAEQQRRAAREARGEPAKNGILVPPAPLKNPWAEQNAARDAHLPAVDNTGSSMQLLDTLDTESNSSSNQEASTAATSVVADGATSRWAEEDDYARAVEESERESGWNEVKSNKKAKSNGTSTPVAAPTPAKISKPAVAGKKPYGFQALQDEGARSEIDSNDPSSWTA